MKFIVETKTSKVTLSPDDLVQLMTPRMLDDKTEDKLEVVKHFLAQLSSGGDVLYRTSLMELMYLGFLAGFHYSHFLGKNNVEVIYTSETDGVHTPKSRDQAEPGTSSGRRSPQDHQDDQ